MDQAESDAVDRTTFQDDRVEVGKTYYYYIVAVDKVWKCQPAFRSRIGTGALNEMKLCRIVRESLGAPRYAGMLGSSVFPSPADYYFENIKIPNEEGALALDEVLLAPVTPSKIVCVGRNYREHAAELGNKMPDEPLCF